MPRRSFGLGLDLEMPGEKILRADAERLVKSGKVNEADVDRMAKSILRTCIAMGLHDRPVQDSYFLGKFAEHEQVALQTATGSHRVAQKQWHPARLAMMRLLERKFC